MVRKKIEVTVVFIIYSGTSFYAFFGFNSTASAASGQLEEQLLVGGGPDAQKAVFSTSGNNGAISTALSSMNERASIRTVSYTHLTLPTILLV